MWDSIRRIQMLSVVAVLAFSMPALAQITEKVVDIPTRPGVTQRMLVLSPPEPKATVVLFAGGHGGLQIFPNGSMKWGEPNFLIRTRKLFAEQGMLVVIVDAPSDRLSGSFLGGFRQRPDHVADIKAVITWARTAAGLPVWLVGTSRGTQSVAYIATELSGSEGPDGIVLTSTILTDKNGHTVPAMRLSKIHVPVLVVHHEQDGCASCNFFDLPNLMTKLTNVPRSQLLAIKGGVSQGDPCEAMAYHGFNGVEQDVVQRIAAWILNK